MTQDSGLRRRESTYGGKKLDKEEGEKRSRTWSGVRGWRGRGGWVGFWSGEKQKYKRKT